MLDEKVVIVTGATSGIGQAAAELFAREGAKVSLAARRAERGDEIARRIVRDGGAAIFTRVDVAEAAAHRQLVAATVSAFGRLDLAFNNAGTTHRLQPIVDIPDDEFDRITSVNLRSVFFAMKYQIPAMLEAGGGAIVNTSSVGGLIANPGLAAYQASKHGVIGLTKVAALDYAERNIRVNAICPGGTHSEMFDAIVANPDIRSAALALHPVGRFADPMEQAQAALFLLSDRASFVTGVALPVDGGLTAA